MAKKMKLYRIHSISVLSESVVENTKRIYRAAIAELFLHIVVILFVIIGDFGHEHAVSHWKGYLIITHSVYLAISLFVFILVKFKFFKRLNLKNQILFQMGYIFYLLMLGTILTAINQSLLTNITPFIIATLSIGSIFIIRPMYGVYLYSVVYLIYAYAISLNEESLNIIMTNRINGLTMLIIGFTLSLINWNNHYVRSVQKREIDKQRKMLEEMAYYDPLTEVPNRRLFDILLGHEIEKSKDGKVKSCIAIVDIDHFKHINDKYGHTAGDMVLKQVADAISKNIREQDFIARLGGEEFILLFSNVHLNQAYVIAEKLRKIIEQTDFVFHRTSIKVTASFGVSELDTSESNETYYELADKALYLAKNNGRNQVQKI